MPATDRAIRELTHHEYVPFVVDFVRARFTKNNLIDMALQTLFPAADKSTIKRLGLIFFLQWGILAYFPGRLRDLEPQSRHSYSLEAVARALKAFAEFFCLSWRVHRWSRVSASALARDDVDLHIVLTRDVRRLPATRNPATLRSLVSHLPQRLSAKLGLDRQLFARIAERTVLIALHDTLAQPVQLDPATPLVWYVRPLKNAPLLALCHPQSLGGPEAVHELLPLAAKHSVYSRFLGHPSPQHLPASLFAQEELLLHYGGSRLTYPILERVQEGTRNDLLALYGKHTSNNAFEKLRREHGLLRFRTTEFDPTQMAFPRDYSILLKYALAALLSDYGQGYLGFCTYCQRPFVRSSRGLGKFCSERFHPGSHCKRRYHNSGKRALPGGPWD
jgi:hypothetical protein